MTSLTTRPSDCHFTSSAKKYCKYVLIPQAWDEIWFRISLVFSFLNHSSGLKQREETHFPRPRWIKLESARQLNNKNQTTLSSGVRFTVWSYQRGSRGYLMMHDGMEGRNATEVARSFMTMNVGTLDALLLKLLVFCYLKHWIWINLTLKVVPNKCIVHSYPSRLSVMCPTNLLFSKLACQDVTYGRLRENTLV